MRRSIVAAGAVALVGCGIGIGRDLRTVSPQAVTFDDECKVQEYFDSVERGAVKPLTIVNSSEFARTTDRDAIGGLTTFGFESEHHLTFLRRMLNENWKNLPPALMTASKVELQVKWAEKAGARRVVTTEDPLITFGDKTSFLPYHICLSEMLFGAPLYKTRRELLGIAPPEPAPPGAPDGGPRMLATINPSPVLLDAGAGAGSSPDLGSTH